MFCGFRCKAVFLTLALLTFWAKELFVVRGSPMHCRMLSSIPCFYPLDTSSSPQCDNQMSPYITKSPLGEGVKINPPPLRTTVTEVLKYLFHSWFLMLFMLLYNTLCCKLHFVSQQSILYQVSATLSVSGHMINTIFQAI